MLYDLILAHGKIIDGTGSPWFYGDIGIIDKEIAAIGNLTGALAKRMINVEGKIVCPGFIDMHTHSDLFVLETPLIEAKIRQGITTDLLGQDGIAAAPLPEKYVNVWRQNLSGLDGDPDITWDWNDVNEYLEKIEKLRPSYNLAFLVPHGNIRMEVLGLENRIATDEEIENMKAVLRKSLDQGACGLSTGLIYPPCCFADERELTALCTVLAEYGVPLVIHQRSEGDEIIESMHELISMMEKTGAHLHLSHLKVCGKENWHKTEEVLAIIDQARKNGVEVTFDQYPYTAGSTMLSAILPPWAHAGGTEKLLERLADMAQRDRMKKEMEKGYPGWDSMSNWAGWDGIIITSVMSEENKKIVGKSILEITRLFDKHNPADVALDLILAEKNAVGMIDFVMSEENVSKIMAHPAGTIGTDGLLGGKPHPRAYGSFPRVLGKYVREERILPLHEMIRRLTTQPARIIGLQDRGIVRAGLKADLVVFDEKSVVDTATYAEPRKYPKGIDYVIVNGRIVIDHDLTMDTHSGQVLRRNAGKNRTILQSS